MKKLLSYILIIFLLAIYIIGSSSSLMQKFVSEKYISNSLFSSDRYRYGDLYGFSYLKDFKIVPDIYPVGKDTSNIARNINLYMICDSYLYSFVKSDSIFCGVNKLNYVRWSFGETICEQLDSSKKNILIIETTERILRITLDATNVMYRMLYINKDAGLAANNPYKLSLWNKVEYSSFTSRANQNLENNLFDFQFLSPIKELKAMFNYRIFNRTDIDVTVSKDKEYLFYGVTTDTSLAISSFNPVSDQEISRLVSNINAAYVHYRNLGFDEVYLSLIPSPVTIIEPDWGTYNELIPKIQNSKELKMPLIDIYTVFKKIKYPVYCRSDSHWNSRGFGLWLGETNKILKKESGF